MCDCPSQLHRGWLGWPHWLTSPAVVPTGEWDDLSHPLDASIPVPKIFPKPSFDRVLSMPENLLNVTRIDMVCHLGTHIDAPAHVFLDGPTIEEIPSQYFHGVGVVWALDCLPQSGITAQVLEKSRPMCQPGDALLLSTGWAKRFGSEHYFDNPYLSDDAVDWIVAHDIKWVGIDFVSPELPFALRPADFDYPVHRKLLSKGILIVENLADCSALAAERVEFVCGALNIKGSDGAPARIFARTIRAPN